MINKIVTYNQFKVEYIYKSKDEMFFTIYLVRETRQDEITSGFCVIGCMELEESNPHFCNQNDLMDWYDMLYKIYDEWINRKSMDLDSKKIIYIDDNRHYTN